MTRTLFRNGTIHPTGQENHIADFMIVNGDGIITATGHHSQEPSHDSFSEIIDLNGQCVLPGFHDPHIHLWKVGHMRTTMLDARGTESIDALKENMATFGKNLKPGQWFLGRGYNEVRLNENRHPTREDLDEVFPDRPAWLIRTCAHIAIANSKAIELAGIRDNDSVPPGGVMHRDDRNRLTGRFDETALGLVACHIPAPSPEDYQEMITAAQQHLLTIGVVCSTDPAVTPDLEFAYRQLEQNNGLLMPTSIMAIRRPDGGTETLPLPEMKTSGQLHVRTMKLFADGGLSGATAALSRNYRNKNTNGVLRLDCKEIVELSREACENGWQIATHAIGDKAIEEVISAYEILHAETGCLRPRIEHFGLPTTEHIHRLKAIDGIAVPQPGFLYELGDNYWPVLDDAHRERTYPYRSLLDGGLRTAFSSDGPVIRDVNPLRGIAAAMNRISSDGITQTPAESITLEQAINCYTNEAAHASFRENESGTLSPGKRADLVILKKNIFEQDHTAIPELKVASTWIAGECAFKFEN